MKYFVAAAMAVGFYACTSGAVAAPRNQVGEWSQVYTIPVVPSSGALLPNGKLLLWSANQQFRFWEGQEEVHFVTIDPDTNAAHYEVQQIPHNMFCTGTTQLPDGRILVNGGSFSSATSLFNPASGRWEGSGNMRIGRGYNANTLLEDGSVLTIGGSWNGPIGGKIGEIWTELNGWRRMEGLKTDSMEHQDNVVWAFDSHFWLVTAGNGRVFYPGPGVNMQWLDTRGEGSVTFAGRRGSDEWAITGLAVMYDKGKILTAGGARQYDETNTSKRAHVIDITGGAVKVQESSPMTFGRAFVNGTVLPDGKVVVMGGQTYMKGFQDNDSVFPTEIWDPATRSFSVTDSISVPRNYHSISLLLQDGRVLSGGGGLCGDCSTNHPDYQIFSPPYLFDSNGNRATRPRILSAPGAFEFGQTIEVTTDSDVTQFSIVRFGVVTHSINNDQRRLSLPFRQRGNNSYEIDLPTNPGWMLPGNWMLFAMNAAGTPSVAKIVHVKPNRTARIVSPFEVRARQGDAIEVAVQTDTLAHPVAFSGKGLPDGLTVNPTTATISGTPTIDGVFKASIVGTGPAQTVSTDFTVYVDPANGNHQNRRPVINAPSKLDVVIGDGVDVTVNASDPDGDTLNFTAAGLPAGLTIDPATGKITGQPQLAGFFESTVTVADPAGAAASADVDWSVTFGDLPAIAKLDVHPVPAGRAVTYAPKYINAGGLTTLWTYGDGKSDSDFSAAAKRSHTYKKPGVYELSVLLKAPDGRMSVFNAVQTVYAAKHPVKTARASGGSAFTGSGRWLWVSNRDNNSVAAIDTRTRRLVHEIPTGRAPEGVAVSPDGQVWVINRGSATISVVSPTKFKVVETIRLPRNSRPFDVVFRDDGRAAVTLEALRQVAILSKSGVIVDRVNLPGSARHLAIDPVRKRIIASRFVSPPAPGEGTAKIDVARARGYVYAIAPSGKLAATTALAFDRSADSEASGRGLPNYLGAPVVSPDGRTAWVPSKKDNITRGRLRDGTDLNFQNAVRAIVSKIDLQSGKEIAGARIDIDNTGLARAGLFHPTGAFLFVALETSRQVAVIDPVGNSELFRFNVGRAPSALAISADGKTLYVHNMMDRTVEVVDLSPLVTRGQKAVTTAKVVKTIVKEKLSAPVLRGKQLFYDAADPRLARDGYLSCAVCHDNAEGDGRTWDFTGFGEGLRNTTSLVGRAGMKHGFLHWSANFDEVQDFEGQIRTFAGGSGLMADADFNAGSRSKPLGDRKAGLSADLDSLAAYLSSLKTTPQSPLRTKAGGLTAKAKAGRALFTAKNCASCHAAPRYTISGDARQMRNVGTINAAAGKRLAGPLKGIDVPTLLGTFATAPYLHDGSAPTLADAIRRHKGVKLSAREMSRIVRFLKEL